MNDHEVIGRHYRTGNPTRVRWAGRQITEVTTVDSCSPELWIAPGVLDPQVNGYGGIDFQQDAVSLEELLLATRQLARDGCGRYLLTLVTDEWGRLLRRLGQYRALRAQSLELQAAVVGWHIEGPFLCAAPGFCGAHDPALMIDPTPAHLQELRHVAGPDPLLLTIAPERTGALHLIPEAVRLGMRVSLGHTNASADILAEAVRSGARAFTHLGNGCPRDLDRHDNILWRVFETSGLIIGLIPDRIHVSPTLFRLIHRLFPAESIYYTTDAMAAAGAGPGHYRLGRLQLQVGADQVVRLPGSANFAGSALRPIDGVLRAARMLDCPWRDVWDRAASVPAELMGLTHGLKVGGPADFVHLDFSGEEVLVQLPAITANPPLPSTGEGRGEG
jgi:N-acetylglucosamine-6-phosphate deacetylase